MLTKVKGLTAQAMKRYDLTDDDYYISRDEDVDNVILTRRGTDKVAKKILMTTRIDSIQTVSYGQKACTTIVMTGRCGDLTEQTTASANPDNCKFENYAEVAEKRAKHRLLLKFADLYQHGIFSEEESDKWAKTRNKYSDAVDAVEKSLGIPPKNAAKNG